MTTTHESQLVRVTWVDGDRAFSGTEGVVRTPKVGDIGAVVEVYSETAVAVECVDADGHTLWLADFHLGEIEHVPAVGDLFVEFFPELSTLIQTAGHAHLIEELRRAPVASRCNCGDAACAHFYTSAWPRAGHRSHENIALPSQSGMVILDVFEGRVVAVEVLDRPDVKQVLDGYLPVTGPGAA